MNSGYMAQYPNYATKCHICHNGLNMVRIKKQDNSVAVRVGPQGRIVIPAHIRRALSIGLGEELLVRIEDGRLVLETRARVLERVQSWFSHVPPEVNLVDELIAERREEVRKEGGI